MKGSINTNMIVLAREARSLNQHELAEQIQMSATNLSKIERGDVGISEDIVKAIAEITGFPLHFFVQPGSIIPEHLGYRKRQKVRQKLLLPINARANILRRHVQFLTGALGVRAPRLPSLEVRPGVLPADIAIQLRREWRLGTGPIANLVQELEDRGIAIISFDFGTERVDSQSVFTDDGQPVIFLNKGLLGDRQRFSLAYELGQLVMHAGADIDMGRDICHEANEFAASFLMPGESIREDFQPGISIAMLAGLKKKWKVSMIALLYRADDLGFLTPNQKRYLLQQFNSMQIRRREPPELDVALEEPGLVKHWISTYRTLTGLGIVEMAALFCLHADEFLELYS